MAYQISLRKRILDIDYFLQNEKKNPSFIQNLDEMIKDHKTDLNSKDLIKFWIHLLLLLETNQKRNKLLDENSLKHLITHLRLEDLEDGDLKHILKMVLFYQVSCLREETCIKADEYEQTVYKNFKQKIESGFEGMATSLEKMENNPGQAGEKNILFMQYMMKCLTEIKDINDWAGNDSEIMKILIDSLKKFKIDKRAFKKKNLFLSHSMVFGLDGGIFLLLNKINEEERKILIDCKGISPKYLQKVSIPDTEKIEIGKGGYGKVRLGLVLIENNNDAKHRKSGDLVCVKKTVQKDPQYQKLNLRTTLKDYYADHVFSPEIYDLSFINSTKGYIMMNFLPFRNGNVIDKKPWHIRYKYIMDLIDVQRELFMKGIALTDLKPSNTLFDFDNIQVKLIDLGSAAYCSNQKDLEEFYIDPNYQDFTNFYKAPEVEAGKKVNLCKAISYNFGLILEEINIKKELQKEIKEDRNLSYGIYEEIIKQQK